MRQLALLALPDNVNRLPSFQERTLRLSVFKANVERIARHNAQNSGVQVSWQWFVGDRVRL